MIKVVAQAQTYRQHAGKATVDVADVRMAIRAHLLSGFVSPPPRQLLQSLAVPRNRIPLPLVPDRLGVRLPPPSYCLTASNYQVGAAPSASTSSQAR